MFFSNLEIIGDINQIERIDPDILNSANGFASLVNKEQPLRWELNIRVWDELTYHKLEQIAVNIQAGNRCNATIIEGVVLTDLSTGKLITGGNLRMNPAIIEPPKDFSISRFARGHGIIFEQSYRFIFHEGKILTVPDDSATDPTTVQAGSFKIILGSPVTITILPTTI